MVALRLCRQQRSTELTHSQPASQRPLAESLAKALRGSTILAAEFLRSAPAQYLCRAMQDFEERQLWIGKDVQTNGLYCMVRVSGCCTHWLLTCCLAQARILLSAGSEQVMAPPVSSLQLLRSVLLPQQRASFRAYWTQNRQLEDHGRSSGGLGFQTAPAPRQPASLLSQALRASLRRIKLLAPVAAAGLDASTYLTLPSVTALLQNLLPWATTTRAALAELAASSPDFPAAAVLGPFLRDIACAFGMAADMAAGVAAQFGLSFWRDEAFTVVGNHPALAPQAVERIVQAGIPCPVLTAELSSAGLEAALQLASDWLARRRHELPAWRSYRRLRVTTSKLQRGEEEAC